VTPPHFCRVNPRNLAVDEVGRTVDEGSHRVDEGSHRVDEGARPVMKKKMKTLYI
jgi:hypothetical protein